MILFCDIDGVLADNTHRLGQMKKKNYKRFYSAKAVSKDTLIEAGVEMVRVIGRGMCNRVVLVTGRNECCREATLEWLTKNDVWYDQIVFRPKNDWRPSPTFKKEKVAQYMQFVPVGTKAIFIDDDPENVKAVCSLPYDITGITFGTSRFSS